MINFELKFRVWHIPQVPGKPFYVEVPTLAEALRLRNALADYDLFQFENKIKPDYSNASSIEYYDHTLTDEDLVEMELDDRWVDFQDEEDFAYRLEEMKEHGVKPYHHLPPEVLEKASEEILNTPGDKFEEFAERITQNIFDSVTFQLGELSTLDPDLEV